MNNKLRPTRGIACLGGTAAGVFLAFLCLGCGTQPEPPDPPLSMPPVLTPTTPDPGNRPQPSPAEPSGQAVPTAQQIVARLRQMSPTDAVASAFADSLIERALVYEGSQWLDRLRPEIQQAIKKSNQPDFNVDQVLAETRKRMDSTADKAVQQALATVRQDIPEVLKLPDSYPTPQERLTNEDASGRMMMTLNKAGAQLTNLALEESSINLGFPPGTLPKARSALDSLTEDIDKVSQRQPK